MAEFDVKQVTPLEWTGVGAGALAFIVSFFPWYSFDMGGFASGSWSAWNTGFLSWFSVLLLMVAGGLIIAPHFGVAKVDRLQMIWLILAGVATLFILIRWLTLPDDGGIGDLGLLGDDSGFESGAGFGLIVGLLLAIASTVAGFLAFRAAPSAAPGGANPAAA
jgi:hypothetical protein